MLRFREFLLEANSLNKDHLVLGNKYRKRILVAIANDQLVHIGTGKTIVVTNKKTLIKDIEDTMNEYSY